MNIVFDSREADDLFRRMSVVTDGLGQKSLGYCVLSLMRWCSAGNEGVGTIHIGLESCDRSFSFQEVDQDGKRRINGGIIFHRNWVKGPDGEIVPPDDQDDGYYSIHT